MEEGAVSEEKIANAHQLLQEMGNFIAQYEECEERLLAREQAMEDLLDSSVSFLEQQLEHVKNSLDEFRAIITTEGIAQWRLIAQEATEEGRAHLATLQQASVDVLHVMQKSSEQYDQIIAHTATNFTAATQSLPLEGFKQVIENGAEQIKVATKNDIGQIKKLVQWFHWKNLAMALVIALFIGFLTGLYDSAQWPWELNKQATKEREAGKAILAAWPYLTPAEQQDIINASNKSFMG